MSQFYQSSFNVIFVNKFKICLFLKPGGGGKHLIKGGDESDV